MDLSKGQKILLSIIFIVGLSVSGIYIMFQPSYEYQSVDSKNINSYEWNSTVTVSHDAPYYTNPPETTYNMTGYLNYDRKVIYAKRNIPKENINIYYTNQPLPETNTPHKQRGKKYKSVDFSKVEKWDLSKIPEERATGVIKLSDSTTKYTFKTKRLSASKFFIRSITPPTDVRSEYLEKITKDNWRTSGTISIQVKDYGKYKRLKKVSYTLKGKPIKGEESITIKYESTYNYTQNKVPKELLEHFKDK